MDRLRIGCHLSSAKGFLNMAQTAVSIDANTFQFFTRNPRGGSAKALDLQDVETMNRYCKEHGISSLLAHAPYTLNACSKEAGLREFARNTMADDLARLEYIPGSMYNFHPGSHVGQGTEEGVKYIADALNTVMRPGQKTRVLLETMAGKGSEVGGRFEELRQIIDLVECRDCVGVCLDTCHVYDAGYDIVGDLDGVLLAFDSIIGLDRLKAVHLNDSMNTFGSRKDRHEKIGRGSIGVEAFERLIRHEKLKDLPFYLETPNETDGYAAEIALLRSLA